MADEVCLDANVVVKLVQMEPGSAEAAHLVEGILQRMGELIGPGFLLAEALSALRKKTQLGKLSAQRAEAGATDLLSLPVTEISGPEVYRKAWQIAGELGMPVIYDAVYLAVAELRGAAFWTADEALYRKARDRGYVHLLRGEQ